MVLDWLAAGVEGVEGVKFAKQKATFMRGHSACFLGRWHGILGA